jgi:hypothetical protein
VYTVVQTNLPGFIDISDTEGNPLDSTIKVTIVSGGNSPDQNFVDRLPTASPTLVPTLAPTDSPTLAPTASPTSVPSSIPTPWPTQKPTPPPTRTPTIAKPPTWPYRSRALEASVRKELIDCKDESRKIDVFPIAVDRCFSGPLENPVSIISQDGDYVTFSVSQSLTGCDELGWIATDFVNMDDEIVCLKESNLKCGHVTIYTAKCEDGMAAIDLFAHDGNSNVLRQTDGSLVSVPDACDATGDAKNTCHFRYLVQCVPSKCKGQVSNISRRLGSAEK